MDQNTIEDCSRKIASLLNKREGMKAYLKMKAEDNDWHGVADAAMDLREIDAQVMILKELK